MSLTQQLETLPTTPGVYIYKDTKGKILYVGKAKVLRSRVRSYFQPGAQLEPSKQQMVKLVASLETIQTDTENEALVLEANLIRKHMPPYNVVLRDDKYYLFIKITKEEFPRVFLTRRIQKDKARYFGPYSSARSVRGTLRILRRIFPFRDEKDKPNDIIFPHPLFSKEVNGPAMTIAAKQEIYTQNIQQIIRFLQGKREDIIATIKEGMEKASKEERFEQAAIFRNQLLAIERLEGFQKVYLPQKESFDAISIVRRKTRSAANVFQIRDGKLLNKHTFLMQHRGSASKEDTLRQFLLQYYKVAQDIPATILMPFELEDAPSLREWINKENPPLLATPMRGKKKQLLTMGETNAEQLLEEQEAAFQTEHRLREAVAVLAKAIGLPKPPHRIETYDISNIQGSLATASMVVFEDGQPKKDQYRKFKIHLDGTPNDFAMLQETLSRRFSGRHNQWAMPDLIIIDGGKGQLSSAKKVLDKLHITQPVISLAKREEEVFLPETSEPVRIPFDSDALYLLQRMRDEAHRFTITYHRLLRSKRQKRSMLDEIPGIGPKAKKKLLNHFGSLKGIRAAEDSEIARIIGEAKTKVLRDYI